MRSLFPRAPSARCRRKAFLPVWKGLEVLTSSSSTTFSASFLGVFLSVNIDFPFRKDLSIMLSVRSMLPTRPIPSLSSGTNESATPIDAICSGSLPISSSGCPSSPMYCTVPCSTGCSPAIASSSSFCPHPENACDTQDLPGICSE